MKFLLLVKYYNSYTCCSEISSVLNWTIIWIIAKNTNLPSREYLVGHQKIQNQEKFVENN